MGILSVNMGISQLDTISAMSIHSLDNLGTGQIVLACWVFTPKKLEFMDPILFAEGSRSMP